jgi:hypothetical protein
LEVTHVAQPEPKRPVIFSGENSIIRLFRLGGDDYAAAASYWRSTYSDYGEGNVLVIWADPIATGLGELAPRAVYADNLPLGRMVATTINQYFRAFDNRGFGDTIPEPARFFQQGDGRRQHRVTCSTGSATIELLWQDVLDAALMFLENTSGNRQFDVSTVICPCARASISINGKAAIGDVRLSNNSGDSSAFLALSETWIAR